jgi:hypothetical protein
MRWSRTHLSPTPSSRSIGAAPSATVAAASSSTGSIRRRPYNPFISLAKPQSEPNRARGSGAGPGRERGGGARRERRDGTGRWRGGVLYYIFFGFLLRSRASSFGILFRFVLFWLSFLGRRVYSPRARSRVGLGAPTWCAMKGQPCREYGD